MDREQNRYYGKVNGVRVFPLFRLSNKVKAAFRKRPLTTLFKEVDVTL